MDTNVAVVSNLIQLQGEKEGLRVESLLLHIEWSQLRWFGHLVRGLVRRRLSTGEVEEGPGEDVSDMSNWEQAQ